MAKLLLTNKGEYEHFDGGTNLLKQRKDIKEQAVFSLALLESLIADGKLSIADALQLANEAGWAEGRREYESQY